MVNLSRPRIKVDFNEMVAPDLVLLSRVDLVVDSEGSKIALAEGLRVYVYADDSDSLDGEQYLLASGVVERNLLASDWSREVPWRCRIDVWGE